MATESAAPTPLHQQAESWLAERRATANAHGHDMDAAEWVLNDVIGSVCRQCLGAVAVAGILRSGKALEYSESNTEKRCPYPEEEERKA